MIIQCEKCQTRFRLDDSRVSDKGVKVRCTKCKHVFTVQKEDPGAELFEPGGAASAHHRPSAKPAPDASADSVVFGDISPRNEQDVFTPFDTSSFDASAISFESNDLQVDDGESVPNEAVEASAVGGVVDFSSFDFGDTVSEPDSFAPSPLSADEFTAPGIESPPAASRKVAQQGLDFSDDDMFGAVVQAAPEASSSTITFDFEGDSFADSMDMRGQDSIGKGSTSFSLDSLGDAPFNLGEIDFGDELTSVAVQQVNPDDLKPSHEILFAPLAEAQEKAADDDLKRSFLDDKAVDDQLELPPLSIASRRKQSPLFRGLIAVVTLLVISALGFFGYSSFTTPKETVVTESGKISIEVLDSSYIENDKAGELLVISGVAFNEYPKPRAALQVKVELYDASGRTVASKSAYCGNPLTDEQLETLPLDKIETAMANQFGDSLANMEVAAGKAISFVVVLANLPKGAKDFSVQAVGSTVATGMQQ